jgi:phosphoribosylformylglycinamidine synthase subunit PurS
VSDPGSDESTLVRATVLVRPKQGILDPQGQAVQASLEKLGFPVEGVRVGRVIDLELEAKDADDARNRLELMCDSLLANPLIESFEVQLGER